MITSPLSLSTFFSPFFLLGDRNMGDLPPNAASPTQPHQSWMRRGASAPHAVVGVGLCHNVVDVSDICLSHLSLQNWSGWS